jgi:hypothetical protein
MMRRALVGLLMVAGCGHVGYDEAPDAPADDGLDGAPADGADGGDDGGGLSPIHQYRFAGNYDDDYGGPPLTPVGGSLGADGYSFGANQGLGVAGAMPDSVYTIDFVFSFAEVDSWNKILDFKDLTTDEGFYTFNPNLQFVIVAGSEFSTGVTTLAADTLYQATLTRDAAGHVVGFLDRVEELKFDDTAGVATLPAPGAIAHFFVDDNATQGEASAGIVRRIRIWDTALTAEQIPP